VPHCAITKAQINFVRKHSSQNGNVFNAIRKKAIFVSQIAFFGLYTLYSSAYYHFIGKITGRPGSKAILRGITARYAAAFALFSLPENENVKKHV